VRVWIYLTDFLDRTDSVELGHAQIEQRDIWAMVLPTIDSFATVVCFSDDGHVGLAFD